MQRLDPPFFRRQPSKESGRFRKLSRNTHPFTCIDPGWGLRSRVLVDRSLRGLAGMAMDSVRAPASNAEVGHGYPNARVGRVRSVRGGDARSMSGLDAGKTERRVGINAAGLPRWSWKQSARSGSL